MENENENRNPVLYAEPENEPYGRSRIRDALGYGSKASPQRTIEGLKKTYEVWSCAVNVRDADLLVEAIEFLYTLPGIGHYIERLDLELMLSRVKILRHHVRNSRLEDGRYRTASNCTEEIDPASPKFKKAQLEWWTEQQELTKLEATAILGGLPRYSDTARLMVEIFELSYLPEYDGPHLLKVLGQFVSAYTRAMISCNMMKTVEFPKTVDASNRICRTLPANQWAGEVGNSGIQRRVSLWKAEHKVSPELDEAFDEFVEITECIRKIHRTPCDFDPTGICEFINSPEEGHHEMGDYAWRLFYSFKLAGWRELVQWQYFRLQQSS